MTWSEAMMPYTTKMGNGLAEPMPWNLQDLRVGAGEIFLAPTTEVEPTASELVAQALAEQERLSTAAFDAGYYAGRAEADTRAAETMVGAINAMHAAVAQVNENEQRYMGVLEENLATLAVCVARQIIAREVRTAPDITIDLIRRAVAEFHIDEPLRVRLNPFDLSALAVARDGDAVKVASGREIAWVPDLRVTAGGCVIEGRERIIDGRVDTALERAYHRLLNQKA